MNIGILLAAGTSSRCKSNKPKQLCLLSGKPIIEHSLSAMRQVLDIVIIVTNSNCYEEISKLSSNVIINNKNCRLESIKIGIDHIKSNYMCNKLIIHDAARPFVQIEHFQELLSACDDYAYAQYCLKLVNGLGKVIDSKIKPIDRDKYIELCSPLCGNFDILYFIFTYYPFCECFPVLNMFDIDYKLLPGMYKHLRKITFTADLH